MRLVSVDPEQTMPLSLKLFSRATGETRFVGAHVLDDERVTIGRSKECTLNLHDPERLLSRVQAELVRAADGYLLKVASSHTPVAVNGKDYPPGSEVMVRVGDTVTMDVHDIEIVSVAAVEPPKPAPAPVRETAPQPRRVIPLSAVKVDTPEALVPPARSKRGAVAGIGIGVVAVVTAAAFFLWPSAKTSDRDAAQKPAPAPVAAAPAPVAAPAVVAAALPTPAEPTPVPPTAAPKSSWDSAAHRTQLESAAGKARECIRSGNVACAEKNIAEAKKHVSHENKTDETVDVKTIESLTDSMELAKKLVRADAVRSDEYKRKAEEERKRATQTAAAPAPALAPAPAPGPSPARAAPPAVAAVTPAPAPARGAPAAPPPPPVAAVAPAPAAPVAPKDEVWVDNYTNSETATGLTKSFPKRDAAIPGNVIASRMGSEKDAKALWGPQGAKTIRYSGCNSPCGIGAKITVVIDFGHMVDTHEYVRIK